MSGVYKISKELEDLLKKDTIKNEFSKINEQKEKAREELIIMKIKYLQSILPKDGQELLYFNSEYDDVDITKKRTFLMNTITFLTNKNFSKDLLSVIDNFQLFYMLNKHNDKDKALLFKNLMVSAKPAEKNINDYVNSLKYIGMNLDNYEKDKNLDKNKIKVSRESIEKAKNNISPMNEYKKNKTRIELASNRFNIYDSEEEKQKLDKFFSNVSSSIDILHQIEQYEDFYQNSSSKVHFNPKVFGTLGQEILVNEFSSFDLKDYTLKEEKPKNVTLIKEIVSFSQKYNNMPEDFTKSNSQIINLISNMLYISMSDKIKTLSEKEQIILFKDLQEITVSYVYLFNAVTSIYNLSKRDFLNAIVKKDEVMVSIIAKLMLEPRFSSDDFIEKSKVNEFKEVFLSNLNIFNTNVSKDNSNDMINNIKENNAKVFNNEFFNGFLIAPKDREFLLKNSSINNKIVDSSFFNPVINIFKIWSTFVMKYDENIHLSKYNRPSFIFNKNMNEITAFVSGFEKAINESKIYDFIQANIEWTGETLGKKMLSNNTVFAGKIGKTTIEGKKKEIDEEFNFNNFM